MKRILIVEDDALLNKTLAYNLISDGWEVTPALNAKTAAALLAGTEYDLVLLDVNLPDGSGYDLCKLIKPEHPDTVVIFLTANDQESDQLRGYEVGAVDYITKPFSIGALQRKIRAMFAMLEHHKPAKDLYDDGRLFLDFSEQSASLNGKPSSCSIRSLTCPAMRAVCSMFSICPSTTARSLCSCASTFKTLSSGPSTLPATPMTLRVPMSSAKMSRPSPRTGKASAILNHPSLRKRPFSGRVRAAC